MPIAISVVFREFCCERAIALGVAGSNPAAAIAKTRRIKRVL
ncbi:MULTISPECIES: hypothetical protein [unclassified Microcoleus]